MHSVVLIAWFLMCAVQDLQQRQIANTLTLGAALLALLYLLWTGETWLGASAADGGWGFAVALAFTVPGYVMGRLGAGDAKLMAALGLASDLNHVLGTFIGAGVFSGLWVLLAPHLWPRLGQRFKDAFCQLDPALSKSLPFAPFLFVGFVLTLRWIH